jgi:hypothetical protein
MSVRKPAKWIGGVGARFRWPPIWCPLLVALDVVPLGQRREPGGIFGGMCSVDRTQHPHECSISEDDSTDSDSARQKLSP